jgi:hypothetical protein
MRHVFWLAAVLLGFLASSAFAAQSTPCAPSSKAITLNFETLMPKPIYNNRLSVTGIRNLFREHTESVLGPHERALGITYALTSFSINGTTRLVPAKGGYCVYLDSVEATFGWKRMDVFVANEFKPGTCEYRAVLDHENQHVSVNNTSLREFAPRFRAQLERSLADQQPVFTTDGQAATDAILGGLQRRMSAQLNQFQNMMAERNAPLDSASNYRETAKLCSNWDGETVPPQARR